MNEWIDEWLGGRKQCLKVTCQSAVNHSSINSPGQCVVVSCYTGSHTHQPQVWTHLLMQFFFFNLISTSFYLVDSYWRLQIYEQYTQYTLNDVAKKTFINNSKCFLWRELQWRKDVCHTKSCVFGWSTVLDPRINGTSCSHERRSTAWGGGSKLIQVVCKKRGRATCLSQAVFRRHVWGWTVCSAQCAVRGLITSTTSTTSCLLH